MNKFLSIIFLLFFLQVFVFTACKKNDGYTVTQDSISSLPEITVHDVDGNLYHGIYLGSQIWLRENLKTTRFRDGTPLSKVEDQSTWNTNAESYPLYCTYNNDDYLGTIYGKLYSRGVVDNPVSIAPSGWRIPTQADWDSLLVYLGGASSAGDVMREEGTAHWLGPNSSANSSGFTALPGGYRSFSGFVGLSIRTKIWSAETGNSYTIDGSSGVTFDSLSPGFSGFSIRCIKEN